MRTIFTITNLVRTSVFGLLTLCTFTVNAQQCVSASLDACNIPITYNFDNLTPGSTSGFSGDFEYDGPSSPQANASTGIQSTIPLTPVKNLISPDFAAPTLVGGEILLRFKIAGSATVTSFNLFADPNIGPEFALCPNAITPVYQGNAYTEVCITIPVTAQLLALFNGSSTFKLRIAFNVSGSNNQRITIDDLGLFIDGSAITLPVNFRSLVVRKDATGAKLTWEVSEEMNVLQYEIERSTDGRNFTKIGTVSAGRMNSYSFVDTKQSSGVVYYRIRSVDADGKYKFSTVVSYSNGRSVVIFKAFPLPAQNSLTVQHDPIVGKGQITISAQDGRIVKKVSPAAGSTQTEVDLSNFAKGMYLLQFANGDGQVQTLKVVKQ